MHILVLEPNEDIRVIADLLTAEGWEATFVEDAGIIKDAGSLASLLVGREYDCCLYCAGGQPVLHTSADRLLPLAHAVAEPEPLRAFVLSRPGPVPAWPFVR